MAGEVVVDALPYIDHGYDDPGVRESALAMVEEECRRYRPTKNYLEHLPPSNTNAFETQMMVNEFDRIQNRIPMETLSMKRYELPPPPAGKLSEVIAWQESIDNSMAQLEHQWIRVMNLELMLEYGIESWKSYLEVFVSMLAKGQVQLQDIKKDIQDVNWQRKQAQTKAGEKLRNLEATWVLLVSKNYEIEQQCAELEKQIYDLRNKALTRQQQEEIISNENSENGNANETEENHNINIEEDLQVQSNSQDTNQPNGSSNGQADLENENDI